jgi:hypothetical protein
MAELTEEEAQLQLEFDVAMGNPFAGLGAPTGFIVNFSFPVIGPFSANATIANPSFDGTAGANVFGGPGVGLSLPSVPVVQGGFTFGVPPSDFAAGISNTVTAGLGVVGVTQDGKGQFVGLSTPNIGVSSSLGIPIGGAVLTAVQYLLEGGRPDSSSVISDPVLIQILTSKVPFLQSAVLTPTDF